MSLASTLAGRLALIPKCSSGLAQMGSDGKYTIVVEKRFPLAKTADALSYGRSGDREGKVIIDVTKDAKKT